MIKVFHVFIMMLLVVYTSILERRMKVGIRELRSSLRTWLDLAARGEEVVITERGAPIARLVKVDGESALDQLIAEGLVTRAQAPAPRLGRRKKVVAQGTVSDLVKGQRR